MPGNKKTPQKTMIIKIELKKNETINLTKILCKTAIFNLRRLTSNLFVTKRKSMVVFTIRVLLLSFKELSPYKRISVTCKSFLSKMCLLMFLIVFRKVDTSWE